MLALSGSGRGPGEYLSGSIGGDRSGSPMGEVPDLRAGDLSAAGLLGSEMRNRMGEEMSEGYVVIGIRGVDYLLTVQEAEKTLLELQAGLYEAENGVGA